MWLWSVVNLVILVGISAGFVLMILAIWRQSTAQKRIADALEEIARKR